MRVFMICLIGFIVLVAGPSALAETTEETAINESEGIDLPIRAENTGCFCNVRREINLIFDALWKTAGREGTEAGHYYRGLFKTYPTNGYKIDFYSKNYKSPDDSNFELTVNGSVVYACEGSQMQLENYDLHYAVTNRESMRFPVTSTSLGIFEFKGQKTSVNRISNFFHQFFFAYSGISCDAR